MINQHNAAFFAGDKAHQPSVSEPSHFSAWQFWIPMPAATMRLHDS